jgi:hypothetical protein
MGRGAGRDREPAALARVHALAARHSFAAKLQRHPHHRRLGMPKSSSAGRRIRWSPYGGADILAAGRVRPRLVPFVLGLKFSL